MTRRLDLVGAEHEVLGRWADRAVARRSLARNAGGPPWICWSEPPAAAGLPGIHDAAGQAVRDMYQRLKAMQGFDVPRASGLDCHGPPVEVAVERELGLAGRADIDAYGQDRFYARCRESALRHGGAFAALSTRLGCWQDADRACATMDAGYIESVWRSLRQIHDAGLLERSYRVTPYCPRCQTPLSGHDLGHPDARWQGDGTAATVRFRLATLPDGANPRLRGADLLAWTARPWTLACNAAIAVHPHQTYVLARRAGRDDRVIVAEARMTQVLGEDWHVAARTSGAELAGASYQPVLDLAGAAGPRPVIGGYFVSVRAGTGLAPLAPAFGADDLAAARTHGLPVLDPIGQDGRFAVGLPLIGGVFFADADRLLITALADAGALVSAQRLEDRAAACWRCGTRLFVRAMSAWYIRTTAVADRLRAEHERIRREPPAEDADDVADRCRDADWMVSRTRYWGTPLPLWECSCGHVTCAGSLAELSELAGRDLTGMDPHRPQIDGVIIACPRCGAAARRVPEVLDARYDAGWMPFAGHGLPAGTAAWSGNRPLAELIVTSADHGSGWPGAVMTIGTLIRGGAGFRSVLCLPATPDASGRGMSRSLGNLVEPLSLIERHGADAVRWFFIVAAPPGAGTALSEATLEELARTVLRAYWNAAAFLISSASAGGRPERGAGPSGQAAPPPAVRPLADRWLLSELQALIGGVTTDLEEFRPAAAGGRIAGFLDALRSWYLPVSGRRFRPGGSTADRAAALATLRASLDVLTRVMAPIVPFVADYVWTRLRALDSVPRGPESVHLARWPAPRPALADDQLASQVALARRLAARGRAAREAAQIDVRQPLARALLAATGVTRLPAELREQVAGELNVRSVELVTPDRTRPARGADDLIGPGRRPDGWAVAAEGGELVALDTAVTPELRREGLAAMAIAAIQDARRTGRLDPRGRIALRWLAGSAELTLAMTEHAPMISGEVLAAEYSQATDGCTGRAADGVSEHADHELGLTFWIRPLGC